MRGPTLAHAGTQSYTCSISPVGWGTYSFAAIDAGDTTKLWAFEEYGGSATACVWKTRLVQYQP